MTEQEIAARLFEMQDERNAAYMPNVSINGTGIMKLNREGVENTPYQDRNW